MGGMTTTLLVFHPEYGDSRIRAAVAIAGPVEVFGKAWFVFAADSLVGGPEITGS